MLDSIQVKKRLAQRGFTDDQAEGLAEELATFTESNLATKSDLKILREEIHNDMDGLREEIREDMDGLRKEIREDMDERFAQVDERFTAIDKQFAQVDKQFAEVKGEFSGWALRIVLAQGAITAALLALYGFAT